MPGSSLTIRAPARCCAPYAMPSTPSSKNPDLPPPKHTKTAVIDTITAVSCRHPLRDPGGLPVRAGVVVDPGICAIPDGQDVEDHQRRDNGKNNNRFHEPSPSLQTVRLTPL